MKTYIFERAPGKPDCKLCNGMGVQGKAKRNGSYKPCKCISEELVAAHTEKVERYNQMMKLLSESRPELPAQPKTEQEI